MKVMEKIRQLLRQGFDGVPLLPTMILYLLNSLFNGIDVFCVGMLAGEKHSWVMWACMPFIICLNIALLYQFAFWGLKSKERMWGATTTRPPPSTTRPTSSRAAIHHFFTLLIGALLAAVLPQSASHATYTPLANIPGCIASYNAATLNNTTTTATWGSGSNTLTVPNTSGFVVGELISATNGTIPANATIASIVANTSITITGSATTGVGVSANITGTGAISNGVNPGTYDGFIYGPSGWNTTESIASTIPYMPSYTGCDGTVVAANTQTCNCMQVTEASNTQKQSVKLPCPTTGSNGWTILWAVSENSGAGNTYILSDGTTTANFNIQVSNPYNVESNAGGSNAIVSTGSNLKQNQGTYKVLAVTFNPTGNVMTVSWDGVTGQQWQGAMHGAVSVNSFLLGTTTASAGGRLANFTWTVFNVYNRVLSWEEIRAERKNIAQATLPPGLSCLAWFGNSHFYGFGASNAKTTSFRAMTKAWLTNGATTTTGTWGSSASTISVTSATGFVPGETISAANSTIPTNTTITSVSGTTIGLSAPTTGTGSSTNVTATGKGLPIVWVEDCVVGRPTQTMLQLSNGAAYSNKFPLTANYIVIWTEDTNQNAAIDSISPYNFTGTVLETWVNDWCAQSLKEYWPYVTGLIVMNTLPRANQDEPAYRTAVSAYRLTLLSTLQGSDLSHDFYFKQIDPGIDEKLAYAGGGVSGANAITLTGFFTMGSPNVSSLVVTTPNGALSDVKATQVLKDTGVIATNATISSINQGAATLVMSANAIQGGTFTFYSAQLTADQEYASDAVHLNDAGNLYACLQYIEPTVLYALAPATAGTVSISSIGNTTCTATYTGAGTGPTGNTPSNVVQISKENSYTWTNFAGGSPVSVTGLLAGTNYAARLASTDSGDSGNSIYSPVVFFTTTGSPASTTAATVSTAVVDNSGRWVTFTMSHAVGGQKGFHVFINGTEWPMWNAGRGGETTVVLYSPHTILASSVHTVTWTYLTAGGDGNIVNCTNDATAMSAVTSPQAISTNSSDNVISGLVVRASTAGGIGGVVSSTVFSVEADNGSATASNVLTQGDMVMNALYGTFNTTGNALTGPITGGIPGSFLTPPVYVPSWNGLGEVQITANSWLDLTKIIIFPYNIQSVPRPTPAKRTQTRLTGVGAGRPTR